MPNLVIDASQPRLCADEEESRAMKADWRRIYAALRVGRSGLVGRGLFAGTGIRKRAKIGE
ncbi:MAG TPA: hypothetical protein VFO24_03440, partial [Usitatibacter sp.]|nr:hypothetical protein [Usitatibacter sp.]